MLVVHAVKYISENSHYIFTNDSTTTVAKAQVLPAHMNCAIIRPREKEACIDI